MVALLDSLLVNVQVSNQSNILMFLISLIVPTRVTPVKIFESLRELNTKTGVDGTFQSHLNILLAQLILSGALVGLWISVPSVCHIALSVSSCLMGSQAQPN